MVWGIDLPPWTVKYTNSHLDSQVAQNNGPVDPKAAHHSLKVAHNYRPQAFQAMSQNAGIRIAAAMGFAQRVANLDDVGPLQEAWSG